jgi:hypothetical protein
MVIVSFIVINQFVVWFLRVDHVNTHLQVEFKVFAYFKQRVVLQFKRNPYYQYFCGYSNYMPGMPGMPCNATE